jgi:hypothetical protein
MGYTRRGLDTVSWMVANVTCDQSTFSLAQAVGCEHFHWCCSFGAKTERDSQGDDEEPL